MDIKLRKLTMRLTTFGVLVLVSSAMSVDESLQCTSWSDVEANLKKVVSDANCTKTTTCTGLNCAVEIYGYALQSALHMNPCENPPSLEFQMNAPKLGINQWRHKFYHGDTFKLSDSLEGNFTMQERNDTLTLGLTMKIHSNKASSPLFLLLPKSLPEAEYPLFHNITFPIPVCSPKSEISSSAITKSISVVTTPKIHLKSPAILAYIQGQRNCTIRNSTCPEHEFCLQRDKSSPNGTCVCYPDFIRDKNGICIYSPTTTSVISSTDVPAGGGDHSKTSETSLLLTAILVPITVIILIVGIVYGTIRFRICQHLRRRLRVQVYEHVLLGQDDDEDDEALSNPVA